MTSGYFDGEEGEGQEGAHEARYEDDHEQGGRDGDAVAQPRARQLPPQRLALRARDARQAVG